MGTYSRKLLLAACLAGVLLTPAGCGKKQQDSISIAQQFGVAYAPLQIMKEKRFLEEKLPGVQIDWKQFGGPTAIREGMLNGEIDFGFMGVAPVLVGIDNGMEWRYAAGLSSNEVAIVTSREDMKSLKDVTDQDRIAILSPACTQHVLLCMLAEEQLGDARVLDNRLVSMSHPDSVNALLSGTEITAHVSTPPYISQEVAGGGTIMATGEEIMGEPFTFITCVAMEEFYEQNNDYYDVFLEALEESVNYINENRGEAVRLLAPVYGISEEELDAQMGYNGTIYSMELNGIEIFSRRMYEMGFIKKDRPMDELVFDNVVYR
ncbi:MAG: ABC transporter substrate-binding protein [Lachnospiraceae bacterium]